MHVSTNPRLPWESNFSPANLTLSRSSGWRTTVETTPPLTPARRCSYLAVRIVEKRPEIPRQTTLPPPGPPAAPPPTSPLMFSAFSERSGGDAGKDQLCGAFLGATEGLDSSGNVFVGTHFLKGWLKMKALYSEISQVMHSTQAIATKGRKGDKSFKQVSLGYAHGLTCASTTL